MRETLKESSRKFQNEKIKKKKRKKRQRWNKTAEIYTTSASRRLSRCSCEPIAQHDPVERCLLYTLVEVSSIPSVVFAKDDLVQSLTVDTVVSAASLELRTSLKKKKKKKQPWQQESLFNAAFSDKQSLFHILLLLTPFVFGFHEFMWTHFSSSNDRHLIFVISFRVQGLEKQASSGTYFLSSSR